MALSTFMLCNQAPPSTSLILSSSQTEALYPLDNDFHSLLPLALAITILLSVSMNLTILGTLYKWNHIIYVLLCLTFHLA